MFAWRDDHIVVVLDEEMDSSGGALVVDFLLWLAGAGNVGGIVILLFDLEFKWGVIVSHFGFPSFRASYR